MEKTGKICSEDPDPYKKSWIHNTAAYEYIVLSMSTKYVKVDWTDLKHLTHGEIIIYLKRQWKRMCGELGS